MSTRISNPDDSPEYSIIVNWGTETRGQRQRRHVSMRTASTSRGAYRLYHTSGR